MVLGETGQTYRFGNKVFTVGGTVLELDSDRLRPLSTVTAIQIKGDTAPVALCDDGAGGMRSYPLQFLMPASSVMPAENGRLYVLSYFLDGPDHEHADVLGISSDKSVLVRRVLDDAENDSPVPVVLVSARENTEEDTLSFNYENADQFDDSLYLEYTIQPVPVYPEHGGETVI